MGIYFVYSTFSCFSGSVIHMFNHNHNLQVRSCCFKILRKIGRPLMEWVRSKQAHYGKKQFQLHPTVAFYRNPEQHLVKHTIMQLSDHLDRHHSVVLNLTERAIEEIKKHTDLKEVILWSDGCAQQYKVRISHYFFNLFPTF